MEYIARKINQARWEPASYDKEGIRADALKCLVTRGDSLSFWECHATVEDMEETALAVAGGMDHVQPFDLVLIKKARLTEMSHDNTPGATAVADLRDRHLDYKQLNVDHIHKLAGAIAKQVRQRQPTRIRRFRRDEILGLLDRAIQTGRLQVEDLTDDVRKHFDSGHNLHK